MSGQDLIEDMHRLFQRMDESLADFKAEGIRAASAEKAYRMEMAKEIARLRLEDKTPVSIVEALAKGSESVAESKRRRDESDVMHNAAKEALNVIKRQYDLLKAIWDKEQR